MKCTAGRLAAALPALIIVTLVLATTARAQSKFQTLHRFGGNRDGGAPRSGLISDAAGNVYGTTFFGGNADCRCGVVFQLTANRDGTWTESLLYTFTGGRDGGAPAAGLIFDHDGNLYGTTSQGGASNFGTVFKLSPNAGGKWSETVLHSFTNRNDGGAPFAGLIFDQAGNLYGTTLSGSIHGFGIVFKLVPNANGSWTESVLHNFGGKDGGYPRAGLIFDQTGNLYGTTAGGGAPGYGVVFKMTPNSNGRWTETVLHVFTGGNDGLQPLDDLIFDQSGNLYGTTMGGGGPNPCLGNGCGVVFMLAPNSNGRWKETVLHSFCLRDLCLDGASPLAGVIFDQAGNLYGTTWIGGNPAFGDGVVFKLAPNSNGGWNETVLHRFVDHPGANPRARLVFDAAGNLYGTTLGDDETTFGSVFQVTP